MARRKSVNTFEEDQDEASMETEVVGVTDDPAPTVEPTLGVNIASPEKPAAAQPAVSATTAAEQEAGRKALADRAASKQAEGEPKDEEPA